MCTVAWSREAPGLVLIFNRDERHTRSPARPPARHVDPDSGLPFLAPIDPDGGGTWIAVNAAGRVHCLLNAYAAATAAGPTLSRGQLVLAVAGAPGPATEERRLRRLFDAHVLAPFLLLSMGRTEAARIHAWDGIQLVETTPPLPFVTTSSHRPRVIEAMRRARYLDAVTDPRRPTRAALTALLAAHDPLQPAASMCMARADARTVSRTVVEVTRRGISMTYTPDPGHPDPGPVDRTIRVRLTGGAG